MNSKSQGLVTVLGSSRQGEGVHTRPYLLSMCSISAEPNHGHGVRDRAGLPSWSIGSDVTKLQRVV